MYASALLRFSGDVGAGTYDRSRASWTCRQRLRRRARQGQPVPGSPYPRWRSQFINSKTYQPIAPAANTVAGIEELVIQAADRQRPYITLIPDADATEWIFEAAPKASDEDVRTLTLEGLWLGILPTGLGPPAGGEFTPVETLLVLDGEFDWVRITHCTLDPGGERARIDPTVSGRHPVRSLENEVGEGTHHRVVVIGAIRDSTSVRTPVRRGRLPFSILSCGIICR